MNKELLSQHDQGVASIAPSDVHGLLARHILADGYDLVFDFERSHGAWLHDSRSGREYLDFCSFYASNPIGSKTSNPRIRMKRAQVSAGP